MVHRRRQRTIGFTPNGFRELACHTSPTQNSIPSKEIGISTHRLPRIRHIQVQHRSTVRWCVGHDTNHHQQISNVSTYWQQKRKETHLGHIDRDQPPLLIIEQERRESFAKLRLSHVHQHRASWRKRSKGRRHTLSTPVKPKNKNDATGRLGACRPAREIRTASLIAVKDSSIYTQSSVNPRSIKGTRKQRTWTNLSLPPFNEFWHRNPCSLRHHPRNIVRRHPIIEHRQRRLLIPIRPVPLRGKLALQLGNGREPQARGELELALSLCYVQLVLGFF